MRCPFGAWFEFLYWLFARSKTNWVRVRASKWYKATLIHRKFSILYSFPSSISLTDFPHLWSTWLPPHVVYVGPPIPIDKPNFLTRILFYYCRWFQSRPSTPQWCQILPIQQKYSLLPLVRPVLLEFTKTKLMDGALWSSVIRFCTIRADKRDSSYALRYWKQASNSTGV